MAEPLDIDTVPDTRVRHVLSEIEFDVLWEELHLGPTPVVLRLPSPGRTRAERGRITATGRHELRRRGLADLAGPAPGPARLLRLLAAPRRQLELRAWFGRPIRALAAERDGDGALAVRRDGSVELSAVGTPAHAVCTTLPPRPGGRGRAVSLPTAELAGILAGAGDVPVGVIDGAVPSPSGIVCADDAALVADLLCGSGGRAQVAAAVYDRWGSAHRCAAHLTVVDTPRGRFRLTHAAAGDGTDWSTLAPLDRRGLHALLSAMLADAGPDHVPGRPGGTVQPSGASNGPPRPGMPASPGTGASTTTSGRSSAVTPGSAAAASSRR